MKKCCLLMAILLCLTFALGGCSSSAPSTGGKTSAPKPDAPKSGIIEPEQLISREEAAQLLGEPVKEGDKHEQAAVGQKICFYAPENSKTMTYIQISITQDAFMNNKNNTPKSIYDTTKENLKDAKVTTKVSDIGDEYFFGTSGLHILTDGYYLVLMAGNSSKAEVQQLMGEAAKVAVKNLKALLK